MSFRLLAITAAAGLILGSSAFAQEQQPEAEAPANAAQGAQGGQGNAMPALAGPQPEWVKLCAPDPQTKKDICQTSRDLRAETGQTLASVALREDKSGKRLLIMAIPPGMQIQPGVRVIVDQQPPIPARYSVCFPNVCLVETEISDAQLGLLRKGKMLNLQALNVQARGVVFPFQLTGFAKAYDGKPVDPKAVQAEQQQLREQMEKKAKEALEKLDTSKAQ